MVDLRVTTNAGAEAVLEQVAVDEFRSSLRGELLRQGDAGYDDARKVWNGMVDKRPALIARCTGVADVINAVNFARSNNLLVAVRGGGHNIAGKSFFVASLLRMTEGRAQAIGCSVTATRSNALHSGSEPRCASSGL